jgi:hypothetical protein
VEGYGVWKKRVSEILLLELTVQGVTRWICR